MGFPLPLPNVLRQALGSADRLRATTLDLALLAGHIVMYPTGIGPRPKTLPAPGAGHPPVLLLHGLIDNRTVFRPLARALSARGDRHVEAINYCPLTSDIRTAAGQLALHVEDLCLRTGHSEVDVVGHSLGGLIARYYVQCLGGDHRVRTAVTLGTPHRGTRVVPLMNAHPLVRQMRPTSEIIQRLAEAAPDCRTRFVSFWSNLDPVIEPVESASLDHPDLLAENVPVTGIGHLALPAHPATIARIHEVLEAARPREVSARSTSVA
ncbi:esterase/lipase family protein [Streptomyces sp. NPDC006879]|uniref:esterase/lipase family protein n=1 Tax=Streptomyces sp. NPDC006879 TaxID=3364767 RepID=UPI00368654A0